MLGPGSLLREAWELVPILLLLLVGGLIAAERRAPRGDRSRPSPGCRQPLSRLASDPGLRGRALDVAILHRLATFPGMVMNAEI